MEEKVKLQDDQSQLLRNLNNNLDKVRSYRTMWFGDCFDNNLKLSMLEILSFKRLFMKNKAKNSHV